ncbi:MAG: hypothetical protein H0V45_08450 [Actinobacteria bacterium]|nr:hypothetical protein [Actinomycetota bacterium]
MSKKARQLTLVATLAAALSAAPQAWACGDGPAFRIKPEGNTVAAGYRAGESFTLVGQKWTLAATPIRIRWRSMEGPVLGEATADANGVWEMTVSLPSEASPGEYRLYAEAYDAANHLIGALISQNPVIEIPLYTSATVLPPAPPPATPTPPAPVPEPVPAPPVEQPVSVPAVMPQLRLVRDHALAAAPSTLSRTRNAPRVVKGRAPRVGTGSSRPVEPGTSTSFSGPSVSTTPRFELAAPPLRATVPSSGLRPKVGAAATKERPAASAKPPTTGSTGIAAGAEAAPSRRWMAFVALALLLLVGGTAAAGMRLVRRRTPPIDPLEIELQEIIAEERAKQRDLVETR